MKYLIIFLFLSMLFCSCKKVKEYELPGTYVSNFSGPDTIFLSKNHTFTHRLSSGKNDIGIWKYKNDFRIDFNFTNKLGVWPADVEYADDKIRIIYGAEEGLYYIKL